MYLYVPQLLQILGHHHQLCFRYAHNVLIIQLLSQSTWLASAASHSYR